MLARTRRELTRLARAGHDWVGFATQSTEALRRAIPFEKSCWHPVDPGTVLISGAAHFNIGCSGSWLAEHEYVLDDFLKFDYLVQSGVLAGSLSQATNGNLMLSARARDGAAMGEPMADELRGAFVSNGIHWGWAALIREPGRPFFSEEEVRILASLSTTFAEGFRRAMLAPTIHIEDAPQDAPGLIVLGPAGELVSISPQAERWVGELVEEPAPTAPHEARAVQTVAARARLSGGDDRPARVRTKTRTGRWLLLYGTLLSGQLDGRVAVIIQPAAPHDVAPLVAAAYGLSDRERQITGLCLKGLSTKQIASTLHISSYTVQDHLKSIFEKTGVRSRAELLGQVFLEHYVTRLEDLDDLPSGWLGKEVPEVTSRSQATTKPGLSPPRTVSH